MTATSDSSEQNKRGVRVPYRAEEKSIQARTNPARRRAREIRTASLGAEPAAARDGG
jgi:hypothetical protein